MDYTRFTMRIEGAAREEVEQIGRTLAEAGLAGEEDAFHAYAFARDYDPAPEAACGDGEAGAFRFDSGGEVKDEPEVVAALRELSGRYPGALFVLDGRIPVEDEGERFRIYFKGGRSQHAERVVSYEPFDEAKLV